jgi:hypothetical protein
MKPNGNGLFHKLKWSLPWLTRYPFWRINQFLHSPSANEGPVHLIFSVANHFEPSWTEHGLLVDWSKQMARVDEWGKLARKIAGVRDHDGAGFRHTYFYPAEQYHAPLLEQIAGLQAEDLGEVEVHLHHGVEQPDTAENTRQVLAEFRDALAHEHRCLSRLSPSDPPMYAFVHGNWALANSANGSCCGVDSEMQILADTGCYADFTLPSAPDISQVSRINAVYQCGHPLGERAPHRSGPTLEVGAQPSLPIIFGGPLVFDWTRRKRGLPVPRIDNGALTANYALDRNRLERWQSARIAVQGRPDWVFIKLYCHGFFEMDQPAMIGDAMRRFLEDSMSLAERTGSFRMHFASARESFNIALAAIDGKSGDPGQYRDYRLRLIMKEE